MTEGTATVVKNAGSHYLLSRLPEWELFPAVLRGRVRLSMSDATNPVAVGDRVRFTAPEHISARDPAVITEVLPRSNYLIRKSTNLSRQSHIIAANIDQAIIAVSLFFPELKLPLLDRILVTCEVYGIPAVIVLNKIDLYGEEAPQEVERFIHTYEGAGYRVIPSSTVTGEGIEKDNGRKPTNFFFVRRNDLLRFPILVSNARTTVAFEQKHMPIGGVPTKYTFDPGIEIPERTFVTDHAGEVTIPYVLEELGEEWTLSYYEGGNWTSGDRYCSAVLVNNRDGLLQKPETTLELGGTTGDNIIPWLDKNDGEYGFIFDTKEDRSGSFTITLDERFYAAEATIKLTLVAKNTSGQTIVLPYTLIIKNNGKAKEETNDDTN